MERINTLETPDYWELEAALALIRALQPETRKFNYHLCLGGGVMNKGRSKKDLDLYFLPMDNGLKHDHEKLGGWLEEIWGKGVKIGGEFIREGQEYTREIMAHMPQADMVTMRVTNMTTGRAQTVDVRVQDLNNPVFGIDYPEDPNSPYKSKMKFNYSGLRIDAFIL